MELKKESSVGFVYRKTETHDSNKLNRTERSLLAKTTMHISFLFALSFANRFLGWKVGVHMCKKVIYILERFAFFTGIKVLS